MVNGGGDSERRSYWNRWKKIDWMPEPSFQNGAAYRTALTETPRRLKDRFFARSSDAQELIESKRESENEMKKCLNWWDLVWMSFGCVVGSGIFSITGQEANLHAGPAIVLSYLISGLSAMLSVFCYTEFSVEVPVAGGSFSYLRIELGDFVSYNAATNILLEAVVGAAGLGRAWSSYFCSIFWNNPDYLRFHVKWLPHGFNMLDPIAVLVLFLANVFAMTGTKKTSVLTWLTSIVTSVVIIVIIALGFAYSETKNLHPFFPYGVKGAFQASAVVYWSYTGFDMVATMAEETKNPSTDIPIGLIGSMSAITFIYCLMAGSLVAMVPYQRIDINAPYSVAFDSKKMKWVGIVVGASALKGMTTSMLVGAVGQARYITQIGRAHMIPPWFALVHPTTGTPINGAILITLLGCLFTFFSSLDVLSSVFSFSTLFIFALMAVALLMRRYYVKDDTPRNAHIKFLVCLVVIIASSIGASTFFNFSKGWIGYSVCGGIWFLGTLGMQLLPLRRAAKIWGVPLVPWLPSLSIATNVFLIGSLGALAIWRFLICSAVMLVYYLFVGLHATYDVAHQHKEAFIAEEGEAEAST